MARLTRAESQQRTRERLLDAAAAIFVIHGYAAASVEQIADRAELTKGAIYSNFNNKEDLFLALLERDMKREQSFWKERSTSSSTRQELLDALAERTRGFEERFQVLLLSIEFQMVAGRKPEISEKAASFCRAKRREMIRLLRRLSSFDGCRGSERVEEAATALIALSYGLALQHAVDPRSVTRGTISRVTNLFLQSLTA